MCGGRFDVATGQGDLGQSKSTVAEGGPFETSWHMQDSEETTPPSSVRD